MISVEKKVIDYFDYDSDSTISETESNEKKDNNIINGENINLNDDQDNTIKENTNSISNNITEKINNLDNQNDDNQNDDDRNDDDRNDDDRNDDDRNDDDRNDDRNTTEENTDLDSQDDDFEKNSHSDNQNDDSEENTDSDNQIDNNITRENSDIDSQNDIIDTKDTIDEKKDDSDDIKEIRIENFFTKEYKGTTLTKKVKDDFYIFGDNIEKEKYLVFCKIIESEISSFREKIERESFGPWPITETDHIKVIENMKIFGYKSVEYYVGSIKSGSIEKMRTIVLDEKLLEYLKS